MKSLLGISIALNAGLVVGLFFVLLNEPQRIAAPATEVVAKARPEVNSELAYPPPPAPLPAKPKPFRWDQLASTNYLIYVKNLRGIGCPELTLRAIVTADAQAVINHRRQVLEQKLADLASQSWSVQLGTTKDQAALKNKLLQLPDEETALVNYLLGVEPVPAATSLAVNDRQPKKDAPLPLVLQKVDPAALGLNSDQIQFVNDLRQGLLDKIGSPNPDPNNPSDLERLQQAQPEADAMLKNMLGRTAYQYYQLAAAGNSQSPEAANP
jgi:hypothetical protein